ncbi:MAG: serine/threonine protein kinase [Gemmatimonadetes bacterium]|nr:serine/threonine protein kinase [Gemmatimonadota bacterium]
MTPLTILPARPSTPSGVVSGSTPLPQDLLVDATRRLGIACLVYGGVVGLYLVFINVIAPVLSPDRPLDDAFPWPGNPVSVGIILCSLLLFGYTRRHSCDCQFALNLGLVYEVLLAFAIAVVNQWTPNTMGVSWVAVLIVIHPAIVPNTPGRTLAASLVAASMDPLAVGLSALRGVELPPWPVLLWVSLPNYVCAFAALVPAGVIRHLGRQVSRARELGSYQLGDLLGKGGMGEVYRAKHRMLQRPAAIKLIRVDTLGVKDPRFSEMVLRRFRKEAEAAASLHSPHTIALYDFGVTGDGTFYHVMELLSGLDFDTLVKRFGPLPPARVVYLLRQVCHSLAEAHGLGLIHRDVKPANLYTCRLGTETDFVKVLDFGLVKTVRKEGVDESLATAPGVATGTPAFMAPEVALGQPDIDHRVDLYALGCVAYWLLTGRFVFEAENAVKMMYEHIRTPPIPPSQRTELPVSPSVDAVILACLAKNAAERPADAEELSRRLASCDVGESWSPERAARWWQTNVPDLAPAVTPPGAWSKSVEVAIP